MKKHLLLCFLFASCASQKQVAQLPAEWKVDDQKVTTGMPNYPLSQEVFARAQKVSKAKRAPASTDHELALEIEKEDKKPSLRRMYFRALYQQWLELNRMSKAEATLKSCPQYHHDKVTIDEQKVQVSLFDVASKPVAQHLPYYPEWALMVKHGEQFKPMWHAGNPKLMSKAFKHHANKIKKELNVICEDGASDAYFRLENMVTYLSAKPDFQREEGLRALLKIPVFSTMLLLKSVQNGTQPKFSSIDSELLQEVKGFQLQRYIVELKKNRTQLLTGSL